MLLEGQYSGGARVCACPVCNSFASSQILLLIQPCAFSLVGQTPEVMGFAGLELEGFEMVQQP